MTAVFCHGFWSENIQHQDFLFALSLKPNLLSFFVVFLLNLSNFLIIFAVPENKKNHSQNPFMKNIQHHDSLILQSFQLNLWSIFPFLLPNLLVVLLISDFLLTSLSISKPVKKPAISKKSSEKNSLFPIFLIF